MLMCHWPVLFVLYHIQKCSFLAFKFFKTIKESESWIYRAIIRFWQHTYFNYPDIDLVWLSLCWSCSLNFAMDQVKLRLTSKLLLLAGYVYSWYEKLNHIFIHSCIPWRSRQMRTIKKKKKIRQMEISYAAQKARNVNSDLLQAYYC